MSILIFLGVLFLLVLVHEWGHYITAKLTGMRVDEFGIGFPPKLFGIKKGETEYTFNALPLGGFVKIYGEDGIGDPSLREGSDYSRSFTGQNRFKQAIVLVAGVTMNVLFAWFLFSFAFMWGVERGVTESAASENARLIVNEVVVDGPASEAELPRGAHITAVTRGGETLAQLTPTGFTEFVAKDSEDPIQIAYTHKGDLFLANIAPKKGVIESDPERAAVGVGVTLMDHIEYSFLGGLKAGFFHTIQSTKAIVIGTYTLARDAIKGEADLTQVAGPVGIVGLVGEASAFGFSALLMFTAFISLNLAVINLLPFPALDGGRLLFVCIEAVTRRPLPVKATQILNTVGFFLLISLMVIVTWNDIARLI